MNIKMKSFELLQYFYSSVHEPLIHGFFHLSGHLNEQLLKHAITLSGQAVPLIFSTCILKKGRPYWKRQAFSGEDVVHMISAEENAQAHGEALLASSIETASEPQLKIFILRKANSDTLYVIMNHMVCDGTGFKEYLYLLSSLYTDLKIKREMPDLKPLARGTGQLFQGFSLIKKTKIAFSHYDLSAQKEQAIYRLEGDQNNSLMLTCQVGRAELIKVKSYARQHGATVNDMILCAYARVLARKTGERHIVIPCPVDLRKYNPESKHAVCNLTSNYICSVDVEKGSRYDETLSMISEQMKIQKQSNVCLKSVIMLEMAFRVLPFRLLQRIFPRVFTIPVLSYTNLGIISEERLHFSDISVRDGYITGAVKFVPYFQISVSTFDGIMTLSCNLHGSTNDQRLILDFLDLIHQELTLLS